MPDVLVPGADGPAGSGGHGVVDTAAGLDGRLGVDATALIHTTARAAVTEITDT